MSLIIPVAAQSYEAAFDTASKTYLDQNYIEALTKAKALLKAKPNDERAHYLLVMCHMRTHNFDEAENELQWMISNSKDPLYKSLALNGLKRIEAKKNRNKDAYPPPVIAPGHAPITKVVWFYTNWCEVCKKFGPGFELAQSRFKNNLKFEKINAEDPKNWPLVAKYKVIGYPTLVYFDAKGNIVENYAGAPLGEGFIYHLRELGAKLP